MEGRNTYPMDCGYDGEMDRQRMDATNAEVLLVCVDFLTERRLVPILPRNAEFFR
jgi:hypothetical protein